jgi:hypothetical protein
MGYLPSLIEMPCPQSCYFTIPHAGRSHGLGDQAEHGCRGNQNRIADPPVEKNGERDDANRSG